MYKDDAVEHQKWGHSLTRPKSNLSPNNAYHFFLLNVSRKYHLIQSPQIYSSPSQGHNNCLFPCWSLCFQASIYSTCNCHINFPHILLYHVTNLVQEAMSNLLMSSTHLLNRSSPPLSASTRSTYPDWLQGPHAACVHMVPHTSSSLTSVSLPLSSLNYPDTSAHLLT